MASYIGGIIALAAVYYGTAKLGLGFDAVSGFATLIWPPTGIALAALFLFGRKYWPGIFAGAFLANFDTGAPFVVAAGIAIGNTGEALLGAFLLKKAGFRPTMERLSDAVAFLGLAVFWSTMVSASIGVTSLWLGGVIGPTALIRTWGAWWVGDMLGNLIVGGLLIVVLSTRPKFPRFLRIIEALGLAASLVAVCVVIFGKPFAIMPESPPIAYVLFLPLLWAALRFGPFGTVISMSAVSVIAVWATVTGSGPFARPTISESLFYLQAFVGMAAAVKLMVASAATERRNAEQEVRRLNKDLERRVSKRTSELSRTNEELVTAKDSLEKRARLLQAMLHSMNEGVAAIDTAGNPIVINPAAMKMVGMVPSEMVSPLEKLAERFPALYPDTRKPVPLEELPLIRAVHGETVADVKLILKSPDNKQGILVSLSGSPITDEKGGIIGGIIVFREIRGEE